MTQPELPRLQRLMVPRMWAIEGTTVRLERDGRQWKITGVGEALRWVLRNDVAHQRFDTRRQALRTAAALLAADPLPHEPACAPLTKVGPGRYRSQGGIEIRRNVPPNRGWIIAGERSEVWSPTLRSVQQLIARREPPDGRDDRPA